MVRVMPEEDREQYHHREEETPIAWYSRINIGAFVPLILQTLALVAWLTQMHADIEQLKVQYKDLDARVDSLDVGGSKAAALLQQRVQTVDERHTDTMRSIDQLAARQAENTRQINELSLMSAREMPKSQGQIDSLVARVKSIEDTVQSRTALLDRIINQQNALSPLQQTVIDNLRADLARNEDRLNRAVIVLDQTYNLINEHMRMPGEPHNPVNPPLNPVPRKR